MPCIDELNLCTGLPLQNTPSPTSTCWDVGSCTYALREAICANHNEGECALLGCCMYDTTDGECIAACIVPDEGEACCVLDDDGGGEDNLPLTGSPTPGGGTDDNTTDRPTMGTTTRPTDLTPSPTMNTTQPANFTNNTPFPAVSPSPTGVPPGPDGSRSSSDASTTSGLIGALVGVGALAVALVL